MNKKNLSVNIGSKNVSIQELTVHNDETVRQIIELAAKGKHHEVKELLDGILKAGIPRHPYEPYWRFHPEISKDGTLHFEHKPTSREALEKYPMKVKMSVQFPKEQIKKHKNLQDLLRHAYFEQEKIEIDVLSFERWIEDTFIDDLKIVKGYIEPHKLPPPMKAKLYLRNSHVLVDYLELTLKEIDQGKQVMTVDNRFQKQAKFLVSVTVNFREQTGGFSFRLQEEYARDVEANLTFCRFCQASEDHTMLALKDLEGGQDIFVARHWDMNEPVLSDIDEQVDFWTTLRVLEEHFDVAFEVPDKIEEADYEAIYILNKAMKGERRKGTFNQVSWMIDDPETLGRILETDPGPITYKSNATVFLFGASIYFKEVIQIFDNVRLDDPEKLKRKLKDMDKGESIRITFIPHTKNQYIEEYVYK